MRTFISNFTIVIGIGLMVTPAFGDQASEGPLSSVDSVKAQSNAVTLIDQVTPDIRALYVSGDGSCYTYSGFGVADIYKDGKFVASCASGDGMPDGGAICGNSKYVFLTCRDVNLGSFGVYRVNIDGTIAPFKVPGKDDTMVSRTYLATGHSPFAGIAASDDFLYVPVPEENIIRVFDANTLAPISWFSVNKPGHIAVDGVGQLWVEQEGGAGVASTIVCYDPTGVLQPRSITLPAGTDVACLSMDNTRNRLIVTDAGPDQNIKLYDLGKLGVVETVPVKLLGKPGGIFAKRSGQTGEGKLNGPCGAGLDDLGNMYVASNGAGIHDGSSLKCYTLSTGTLQWKLLGLIAADVAEFDPAIETDIYTSNKHLLYNYAKPAGKGWIYNGYTLDRFRYPADPRLVYAGSRKQLWVRHIAGRPCLYFGNSDDGFLAAYRFNKTGPEGEIAVPAFVIARQSVNDTAWPPTVNRGGKQAATGWRVWRDNNGDGQFGAGEGAVLGDLATYGDATTLDSAGNIWLADEHGITCIENHGFDGRGVPYYATARPVYTKVPSPLLSLTSLVYDPKSDVMYLAGSVTATKDMLVRYDKWSAPERRVAWKIPVQAGTLVGHNLTGFFRDKVVAYVSRTTEKASGSISINLVDTETGKLTQQITTAAQLDEGPASRTPTYRLTRRKNGEYILLDGNRSQMLTLVRTGVETLNVGSVSPSTPPILAKRK
ncbi:MAG TPA: hypothetical protein VGK19_07310 [Capsulimonadaceae bacterium]|jgi:hypothetical protein